MSCLRKALQNWLTWSEALDRIEWKRLTTKDGMEKSCAKEDEWKEWSKIGDN